MSLRFLAIAQAELDEAIAWYGAQAPGLGQVFFADIIKALGRIERYPHTWPPLTPDLRRCRLMRFPYGIIYEPDELLVIAVAHLHRAPLYWRDRKV
ncbi:hypothetical protein SAMN05519103_08248 [Rhizobiales bacterium GAS113]|nr:hypothetical protein SAMN05519103_08248 [Rhizobiales bacterium GAS113]